MKRVLDRSVHRSPRRLIHRLTLLYGGLVMGGIGLSMFVVADLGLDPWDVLHQGISESTGASLGTIVILSSLTVLLLWIPLRQRPGLGTLSDVVVIGLVIDASLAILPRPDGLALRMGFLATALVLNGVSTSMYIAARMGAGPRDGLMTGLAARGWSIRRSRIVIDLTVLIAGWFLGGTVGIGTLASAMSIGPLVHYLLPRFSVSLPTDAEVTGQPVSLSDLRTIGHRLGAPGTPLTAGVGECG